MIAQPSASKRRGVLTSATAHMTPQSIYHKGKAILDSSYRKHLESQTQRAGKPLGEDQRLGQGTTRSQCFLSREVLETHVGQGCAAMLTCLMPLDCG